MGSNDKSASRLGMLARGLDRAKADVQDRFARAAEFEKEGGTLLSPAPGSRTNSGEAAAVATAPKQVVRADAVSSESAAPPAPAAPAAQVAPTAQAMGDGFLRVPLALVHDNKYNARKCYSLETIKQRAESIMAQGQMTPCAAVVHPSLPGEFMLLDGGYRKRALAHLNASEINLDVRQYKDEVDLYRLSRLFNEERESGTALDDALSWKQLLDDGLLPDLDAVGELVGKKKASISKTMSLLKLPAVALTRISEQPASFGSAVGHELYQLSLVVDEAALMKAVEAVAAGELSTREIEALREQALDPKTRKPKVVSRQYPITMNGEKSGVLREWDSGRVALDVQFKNAAVRDAFVALVRANLVDRVSEPAGD